MWSAAVSAFCSRFRIQVATTGSSAWTVALLDAQAAVFRSANPLRLVLLPLALAAVIALLCVRERRAPAGDGMAVRSRPIGLICFIDRQSHIALFHCHDPCAGACRSVNAKRRRRRAGREILNASYRVRLDRSCVAASRMIELAAAGVCYRAAGLSARFSQDFCCSRHCAPPRLLLRDKFSGCSPRFGAAAVRATACGSASSDTQRRRCTWRPRPARGARVSLDAVLAVRRAAAVFLPAIAISPSHPARAAAVHVVNARRSICSYGQSAPSS